MTEATLIGDVTIGAGSCALFGAVIRADNNSITIGESTNLQDNVVVHVDEDAPVVIGSGVSIGHGAVVHGCTIGDDCLIGMNATVLNHAEIGAGSLVAAGAVVLEGTIVPPGSLVAGVPAKVRRELTDDERAGMRRNAEHYVARARGVRRRLEGRHCGYAQDDHRDDREQADDDRDDRQHAVAALDEAVDRDDEGDEQQRRAAEEEHVEDRMRTAATAVERRVDAAEETPDDEARWRSAH